MKTPIKKPYRRISFFDFLSTVTIIRLIYGDTFHLSRAYWEIGSVDKSLPTMEYWFLKIASLSDESFTLVYTFAFLLGWKAMMQVQIKPPKAYLFRVLMLFLIGFLQIFFIWPGDILTLYAVFSIIIPGLKYIDKKALPALPLIIFLLYYVFFYIESIIVFTPPLSLQQHIDIYRNGSFWLISQQRLQDFWNWTALLGIDYHLNIGFITILGAVAYTLSWHEYVLKMPVKKLGMWALGFSTVIVALFGLTYFNDDYETYLPFKRLSFWILHILLLALLWRGLLFFMPRYMNKTFIPFLSLTSKSTLTHYVLSNLCVSFLLYSYGFKQYYQISNTALACYAGSYMLFAFWFNRLWFKHFRYGPLERLLRLPFLDKKSTTSGINTT